MPDRYLLTPYYLDQSNPALLDLAGPDWTTVSAELPAGTRQERMASLYEPLAGAVAQAVSSGDRPVSIAGDCCSAIGVFAGLQRAGLDPVLIWFDAHGDFNTWETTPSGFLGGMPLAMLVGRGEQTIPGRLGLRPLPEANVYLVGARDLDLGEKLALAESEVTLIPDPEELLDRRLSDRPIHIHFDTDVVDPQDAPAMNYPAPGGPRAKDLDSLFRAFARAHPVRSISVSCWEPSLDADGRTRQTCMSLLETLVHTH